MRPPRLAAPDAADALLRSQKSLDQGSESHPARYGFNEPGTNPVWIKLLVPGRIQRVGKIKAFPVTAYLYHLGPPLSPTDYRLRESLLELRKRSPHGTHDQPGCTGSNSRIRSAPQRWRIPSKRSFGTTRPTRSKGLVRWDRPVAPPHPVCSPMSHRTTAVGGA